MGAGAAAAIQKNQARSQVIRRLAGCCLPIRRYSGFELEYRRGSRQKVEAASLGLLSSSKKWNGFRSGPQPHWRQRRAVIEELLREAVPNMLVVDHHPSRRYQYHPSDRQHAFVAQRFPGVLHCVRHHAPVVQCFSGELHCVHQHALAVRCAQCALRRVHQYVYAVRCSRQALQSERQHARVVKHSSRVAHGVRFRSVLGTMQQ